MKTISLLLGALWCLALPSYALETGKNRAISSGDKELSINITSPQDTIRIKIGADKEIIIYVADKAALESLQNYDLNQMVRDVVAEADSTLASEQVIVIEEDGETYQLKIATETRQRSGGQETTISITTNQDDQEDVVVRVEGEDEDEDDIVTYTKWPSKKVHTPNGYKRTTSSLVFDLGINNLSNDGQDFTQNAADGVDYSVKGWGSWNVGIGQMFQTHLAGPLAIQWGANINWYNFKFENPNVLLRKNDGMVEFYDARSEMDVPVDAEKSKLTVNYVNATLVPMLDFGYKKETIELDGETKRVRTYSGDAFRIGLGGYVGYRIDSYTKIKYDDDKNRDRDNFYLNNWRYGLRLQLGIKGMDVYANYDLNNLFRDDRGPELNAFSFGINF